MREQQHKMVTIYAIPLSCLNAKIPLVKSSISAGFPSPADDYIEAKLSLDDLIIKNRSSTFFVKVQGDSMKNASISDGDILVVDRSQKATANKIIIAVLNNEFTVKRLTRIGKEFYLKAENASYSPIKITKEDDFYVWGVVIRVIHQPN